MVSFYFTGGSLVLFVGLLLLFKLVFASVLCGEITGGNCSGFVEPAKWNNVYMNLYFLGNPQKFGFPLKQPDESDFQFCFQNKL